VPLTPDNLQLGVQDIVFNEFVSYSYDMQVALKAFLHLLIDDRFVKYIKSNGSAAHRQYI